MHEKKKEITKTKNHKIFMFLNANFEIANEANTELKIEGGSFKGNSI